VDITPGKNNRVRHHNVAFEKGSKAGIRPDHASRLARQLPMSSGNDRLDKVILEARRNADRRAAGYRENTAKVLAPFACGTDGGYAKNASMNLAQKTSQAKIAFSCPISSVWDWTPKLRATQIGGDDAPAIRRARHIGVDALEKAAHLLDRPHRNQLNAVKIGHRLHFLPWRQLHRYAYGFGNNNLEFGGNGQRFHGSPIDSVLGFHPWYRLAGHSATGTASHIK